MASIRLTANRKAELEELAGDITENYFPGTHFINPFYIARKEEITYSFGDYRDCFTAMIHYAENSFHIYIHHPDGKKVKEDDHRYTAAHELAHRFIPEHYQQLKNDGFIRFLDGDIANTEKLPEKEAEFFASCLLMPRQYFMEDLKGKEMGFQLVTELARKYQVSLTAILLRMLHVSELPMMVICSRHGSKGWQNHRGKFPFHELKLGENNEAPEGTVPFSYFHHQMTVPNETRQIDPALWFTRGYASGQQYKFFEFNFLIKSPGMVMTVVWMEVQ